MMLQQYQVREVRLRTGPEDMGDMAAIAGLTMVALMILTHSSSEITMSLLESYFLKAAMICECTVRARFRHMCA
jgi:hypothetical protein